MAKMASKTNFKDIRYAQVWEDADVLLMSLGKRPGATLASICSAGDNALAMLTLEPARVIAVDLSPAQIECLKIRIAAFRELDHRGLLELLGSRESTRRGALLDKTARTLSAASQSFWLARRDAVIAHGLAGIGKFECYFRIFRRYILPLVHQRNAVQALLTPRPPAERERFLREKWNTWGWQLLVRLFFSRWVMGRVGRAPSFFDEVEGNVSVHVMRRIFHAGVELDPCENPYLHWILNGTHAETLPLPYRAEHFDTIRDRLGRIDIRHGTADAFLSRGEKIDGFNLSDIFEYMTEREFETVYGRLVHSANPGARLVYWNMMVPRRRPPAYTECVSRVVAAEQRGKAMDRAFFYSDFVVEEVQ